MWPFSKPSTTGAPILLHDTLSGTATRFAPMRVGQVLLYSCGPTVYGPQHIGNLRSAVFSDTLSRVLSSVGYRVQKTVNITDVGHLVGDGDEGEDKMAVGAARDKTTPEAIAKRYTDQYLEDCQALGIDTSAIRFPRASDYIPQQIAMIETLEQKGFAYRADDGVYFDTAKFPEYGKLGGINEVHLRGGARVKMVHGKKNIHDFALWRTAKKNDLQVWDSPWGPGNPGWSIECSAMARATLGETLDIHTGGEDHIGVHHNNEIAQSEAVTGRPLARYWMHNAFLTIEGEKISKSLGNTYTLADVSEHGLHPLSLRFFFMQAHYRSPLSFSWDALEGADGALKRLWRAVRTVARDAKGKTSVSDAQKKVESHLRDDLGTAQALAFLFESLGNDDLTARQKWGVVLSADAVLGLSLSTPPEETATRTIGDLPESVRTLALKRENARTERDFAQADQLRIHIENSGYRVDDGPSGTIYTKQG